MAHHPKRAVAYAETVQAMLSAIQCKLILLEAQTRHESWRHAKRSDIYGHAPVAARAKITIASTDLGRAYEKAKADFKKALVELETVSAGKDVFGAPPAFDPNQDFEEIDGYTTQLVAWIAQIRPAIAGLPAMPGPADPSATTRQETSGQPMPMEDTMDVDEDIVELPPPDLRTRVSRLELDLSKMEDNYEYEPPVRQRIEDIEQNLHDRLDRRVHAAVQVRQREMEDDMAARTQATQNAKTLRASESLAIMQQIRANQVIILQLRAQKAKNEEVKEQLARMREECSALRQQVERLNDKTVHLLARDPAPMRHLPRQQEGISQEALLQQFQSVVDRVVQEVFDEEVRPALTAMSNAAGALDADIKHKLSPHLQRGIAMLEHLRRAVGVPEVS